jgi:hypothetical protein
MVDVKTHINALVNNIGFYASRLIHRVFCLVRQSLAYLTKNKRHQFFNLSGHGIVSEVAIIEI